VSEWSSLTECLVCCAQKCKKFACNIQYCLARNDHMEKRCAAVIAAWRDCCTRVTEQQREQQQREQQRRAEAAAAAGAGAGSSGSGGSSGSSGSSGRGASRKKEREKEKEGA
jgi:uncharacterized membrane protein YgcG